jgi:hypothetical protein
MNVLLGKQSILLNAASTNQTGSPVSGYTDTYVLESTITGSGSVSATVQIYGKATQGNSGGTLIATHTLTGTNTDTKGTAISGQPWSVYYATLSNLTGTPTHGSQTVSLSVPVVGTDATGLLNTTNVYHTTITVDGTPIGISVTGSAAQTYTALDALITTALGSAATLVTGTNMVITSATTGSNSSVSITSDSLFMALTQFTSISAPINGITTTVTTVQDS